MPGSRRSTSIRRIEDNRSEMSWPVSSGSGGFGLAASPVETYSMPSGPKWRSPPLCPPCRKESTTSSLAGSIRGGSVWVTVNRDTRVPSARCSGFLPRSVQQTKHWRFFVKSGWKVSP